MKHVKKIFAFAVALFMAFAVALPAFAQTVDSGKGGNGSITITNAAKGETYAVYKLFDATYNQTNDSIAYTGTIPASLTDYFEKDAAGNISAKVDNLNEAAQAALKTWTSTATAEASEVSDGSDLVFSNLKLGYYVVTTTQGEMAISVDSTKPNVSIEDKNTTTPINNPTKSADETDVYIGQDVTYTVAFGTASYNGTKQIINYFVNDNFAGGKLTNVHVDSIVISKDTFSAEYKVNGEVPQFNNGRITIPWVDADSKSLYPNGATLTITYTGTVADDANIDGNGNTNTATISFEDTEGEIPGGSQKTASTTIYTYAIAIKKVDQAGQNLSGATFQFPFYVKANKAADGAYIYAGTTAGDGLVNTITTPADGLIIVKGVKSGTYDITETNPPAGYNKLTSAESITATKTGQTTTSTTTYLDKDGNIVDTQTTEGSTVLVTIDELAATPVVVVNKTGTEMPSTGGIGTTIFYVVGGVMVAGAVVFLLTKRRAAAAE